MPSKKSLKKKNKRLKKRKAYWKSMVENLIWIADEIRRERDSK